MLPEGHIRVWGKHNGYCEVIALDNIWDKAYKKECIPYEELSEEIQRKLAVLTMLEPNDTVQGVGRRSTQTVYWICIDSVGDSPTKTTKEKINDYTGIK